MVKFLLGLCNIHKLDLPMLFFNKGYLRIQSNKLRKEIMLQSYNDHVLDLEKL